MAKVYKGEFRKISFLIPHETYDDLAVLSSAQPGAPAPGPYMRDLSLKEAEKGKQLRAKLVSKKR